MKNSRQSYLFSTCLQYVLHALPISPFFILIKQFLPFLSFFFYIFYIFPFRALLSKPAKAVVSVL